MFYALAPSVLRNNIVTIGFIGSYKVENLPTDALTLATQSLIRMDASGKAIPSLASNWTVSEDGKTYVVFLKDNISWHDGTPLQASDISLAISGVEVTAVNNKTLQFSLPNPISSFPQALDTPVFKAKTFYGTGKFRIVDISKSHDIVKMITLHPDDESMPKVEIRFYPNNQQALNALKIGEIKSLLSSSLTSLTGWKNLKIAKDADTNEIVTIFINNSLGNFANKDVRQALWYAIRKDGFEGEVTSSPISTSSWAFNSAVKKYEYNTARAKELLNSAEVKDLKVVLSFSSDLATLAENVKMDWEAAGVQVELKEEKGIPQNYQAFLAVNKLPKDPDQYALWHSTQPATNITRYKNVKIDKLLEDARLAKNDDERKQFYLDFQKFLSEDAPAIFLYHPYKYNATYKNIQNLINRLPTN